jgi:hypothetical protein
MTAATAAHDRHSGGWQAAAIKRMHRCLNVVPFYAGMSSNAATRLQQMAANEGQAAPARLQHHCGHAVDRDVVPREVLHKRRLPRAAVCEVAYADDGAGQAQGAQHALAVEEVARGVVRRVQGGEHPQRRRQHILGGGGEGPAPGWAYREARVHPCRPPDRHDRCCDRQQGRAVGETAGPPALT